MVEMGAITWVRVWGMETRGAVVEMGATDGVRTERGTVADGGVEGGSPRMKSSSLCVFYWVGERGSN